MIHPKIIVLFQHKLRHHGPRDHKDDHGRDSDENAKQATRGSTRPLGSGLDGAKGLEEFGFLVRRRTRRFEENVQFAVEAFRFLQNPRTFRALDEVAKDAFRLVRGEASRHHQRNRFLHPTMFRHDVSPLPITIAWISERRGSSPPVHSAIARGPAGINPAAR